MEIITGNKLVSEIETPELTEMGEEFYKNISALSIGELFTNFTM